MSTENKFAISQDSFFNFSSPKKRRKKKINPLDLTARADDTNSWKVALPHSPPSFTMRAKEGVNFGAMIKSGSFFGSDIPKKNKWATDPLNRPHPRNWSAFKVKKWFHTALEKRNADIYHANIPEDEALNGVALMKKPKKWFTDTICDGNAEIGGQLFNELRNEIVYRNATLPYTTLDHCINFAYPAAPHFTCAAMTKTSEVWRSPGPAQYKAICAFGMGKTIRGPHPMLPASFRPAVGQAARFKDPHHKTPGPGQYRWNEMTNPCRIHPPKWSLGSRQAWKMADS